MYLHFHWKLLKKLEQLVTGKKYKGHVNSCPYYVYVLCKVDSQYKLNVT